MTERELLQQYRASGELDVLGKLYAPYMSLLYGVCFKYLNDADRSQDAVMQIFEELIDKLRIHQVDNFKSWLYTFSRNYCLMQLRKDKRVQQVDIEDHLAESEHFLDNSSDQLWDEVHFEKLETCMLTLNPEQERCIRLFYLEQKCYKDIVEETGYDMNKVKSYIQNGKRNLKICMEKK
ncbi:RNA polymerase sigma factor [Sphingobacterium spiritivorum]|uniref:Sigma-70 region 2 n=1 Tax=Sphingobacterium spiritivorum ATCC 33861 TaxID=525373 RepID=D7VL18_SPHSI|nr:sigma-70 family RNA polymerase sigma factor [Sphingobacterium spiritivorum]EFK58291.1 Sigma-70 region 2 [Sphingobacterium spiritivorum ATCC 33861]QQT37048.1 sigma-70 family RNA polymerase sigma factor [Sphingobacterium spiritivorum]WQD33816.1 sigma-70 family RNA polymerase sigma factor [Sphingobacterium spiritivorum]SUJ27362.1 RNA polymerase sigma factor [Sphingobacterium spiritivorum]